LVANGTHFRTRVERVPYVAEVERQFASIVDQPWAVWLDSGHPHGGGRYDICAADPYLRVVTRGALTRIQGRDGATETTVGDPLAVLREHLSPKPAFAPEPFAGGAIGYFGYEFGHRLERLPVRAAGTAAWPDMAIGLYDWALITDHAARRSWVVSAGRDSDSARRWAGYLERFFEPVDLPPVAAPQAIGGVRSNLSGTDYADGFAAIKRYIHDGDCYQVNYAQRFEASVEGGPWNAYRRLRAVNPAPYGAYLHLPFGQVLSCSPEQFLQVARGRVRTRPIKGTRPRGETRSLDEALRTELRLSEKDRAENLMIVDLLRNDLGKACRPGSIRVPKLFVLESFATVHHLVSEVTGRLRVGLDSLDLLAGAFPGGSITGAPKHRAMQIIAELEPDRRDVYCGSIGYLSFDGSMDTNIAIRTALWRGGEVRFHAGGGIVADSEVGDEYYETLVKAEGFLRWLSRSFEEVGPKLASVQPDSH
jgi:para-aminobenzoate synthetase component 1